MRKLYTVASTIAAFFLANVSTVLADTAPYTPYEPHKPVPTGFDDTSIFYIAAMITFATGMLVLAIVKNLKAKQSI